MINIIKKLSVFPYSSCTVLQTDTSETTHSLFLSVPICFYIDFIKEHYKSFLLCLVSIVVLIISCLFAPYSDIPKKITNQLLPSSSLLKSDTNYIQNYNPSTYEEMLKILQGMQHAAFRLQIKQQASDRKTLALQQQIQKLQVTTNDNTAIVNEEKAQKMIKEALSVYDADKLGLRDYALESLGGTILSTPLTTPKLSQKGYVFLGFFNYRSYSNPRILIQPEVQPGNCFAFEGSYGKIRIKLSNEIYVSAITLEHAPITLLTQDEMNSAPQSFSINGLAHEKSELGFPLGQFTYSIEGPSRQTFLVMTPLEIKPFKIIELEILSNHGNPEYTCIYRLRVHGRLSEYS